jgi:hypothetical protein
MASLFQKFTDHPKSNNMTYWGHMRFAMSLAAGFIFIGLTSIVHAVFPFLFKDYASSFVEETQHHLNRH